MEYTEQDMQFVREFSGYDILNSEVARSKVAGFINGYVAQALAAEREKARGLVEALEKMQSLWYGRGPHFNADLTEEEFYEADTKWTDECIANMDATLTAYHSNGEV